MKEIQTVEKDCPFKDCIYRKKLHRHGEIECCMYSVVEGRPRGCRISECDKYKGGSASRPRMGKKANIWWEYELNDGN